MQDNEKKPALRFKGFTDPWEQRKISELAEKTYGGGTPTTSNEAFWNGNIPWIQSSDIVDGKLIGVEPRKYITQTGLNSSATQLVPKIQSQLSRASVLENSHICRFPIPQVRISCR